MSRWRHGLLTALVMALRVGLGSPSAHQANPGLLTLQQTTPERFLVQWVAPAGRPGQPGLQPAFPPQCAYQHPWLDCGSEGLTGALSMQGLHVTRTQVVVQLIWQNGVTHTAVLSPERPFLSVSSYRGSQNWPSMASLAYAYMRLGIEHILLGLDHLLFVLGLVLLVGFGRRLAWAITAFTLAHSCTLAGSVLELFTLPQAPVEAVIALSIVLVTVEGLQPQVTYTQQMPWAVSFGFGLLHGCGFARALQDIGLPPGHVPWALLWFNIGVEVGQLGVIGSAALLFVSVRSWATFCTRARIALLYTMGTVAAFWSVERIVSLLP